MVGSHALLLGGPQPFLCHCVPLARGEALDHSEQHVRLVSRCLPSAGAARGARGVKVADEAHAGLPCGEGLR